MRNIKQIKNLKGKIALVRVDFNVPIKNGKIVDDFRIKKALPTLKFLEKKGAKIILISHLGKDGKESLKPIADYLKKKMKNNVVLLENIRRYPGEEKNDLKFAKKLSKLGDIYVNEAFSVSHRSHASIVGLPKFLPSYAGFQMEEEIKNLSKAIKNVKHPFLFILGGAKFSTKIPLIKRYLKQADYLFVGGAILKVFLKAEGCEIGENLDTDFDVKSILKNKKLILPVDVLVKTKNGVKNRDIKKVKKGEFILDIGEKTIDMIKPQILRSKLILWNGPLGKYEDGGDLGTKKILKLVAQSKAESIIGGGDTATLISQLKLEKNFTFVSTGGGATLDFLANGTLPGIKALK